MNGWLGPISLRLVDRGPVFGGLGSRMQDLRQPSPFLGEARLRRGYELGRPVAHLSQPPNCCNSPDGTKCFDHSTGECINTWNSTGATPNVPDCVQNPRGEWVHPDCYTPPAAPVQMEGRVRRLSFYSLGAWVKDLPPPPAPAPAPEPTPAPQLIACVNGPDLYDVYNPDMTLVEKAVLHPEAKYPGIKIEGFPPCPVPQATGVGGLCDIPGQYLAPKDPNGPRGKPVLACFDERGVTLFDYVTGAVIGTHLNASCLSLLSDVTRAQPGDSRCGNAGAATVAPPPGGGTGTTPPSGGTGTTPPSGSTGTTAPSGSTGTISQTGGESMPVSNIEPMPATGGGSFVPVLPPPQSMTTASPPTGAFPGQPFAAMPPAQKPIPTAKAPAPLPPTCPLGPVPIAEWAKGCMGS